MSKKYTVINHGFIKDSKDEKTDHPTQKPTELFRMILDDFSKQSEIILDPFMGSGTTGIASVGTGRIFKGCEIDTGYFNTSKRRIEQASRQGQLFGPPANISMDFFVKQKHFPYCEKNRSLTT